MMNAKFEAKSNEGHNIVELDGWEIQDFILSYNIFHSGSQPPRVSVQVGVPTNAHYDNAQVELDLSSDQIKLLEKFGWMRPAEKIEP